MRPRVRHGAGKAPRHGAQRLRASLASAWLALFAAPAWAVPFVPASDTVVLERLPDAGDATARHLREKNRALAADPKNLALALEVARGDLGPQPRLG